MKTKVLILGTTGFLGGNLTDFFIKNPLYEVFGTVPLQNTKVFNKKATILKTDLSKKYSVESLFDQVKPDIVLHFAAYTTNSKDVVETPFNHATTNYIINSLVLEAAHKAGVKHFIYPSCGTMYSSSDKPLKESQWSLDTIPKVYKHVAFMKTATERMCEAYADMGKCKYSIIRLSNVFGPKDKIDTKLAHLVPSQIIKILKAKDTLEVWGDPNPKNQAHRDIIYVDDVVNMVDLILQKQKTPFELYNCGQGKAYSVSKIIEKIQKAANKENLKVTYNNSKPNIPTKVILDCSKAKKELGWEPKVSIEEGLKKTIEWYKEN